MKIQPAKRLALFLLITVSLVWGQTTTGDSPAPTVFPAPTPAALATAEHAISGHDPGPKGQSPVTDLLKLLLKIKARESNVAPRLVAKAEELEQLAAGRREGLSILEGWRYEEFGHDALDLVEGRLAFAVRNGKLVRTRVGDEDEE